MFSSMIASPGRAAFGLLLLGLSGSAFSATAPSPGAPGSAVGGITESKNPPAPNVVATVNGENLTREQLVAYMMKRFGSSALQQLIDQEIRDQAARKQGVTVTAADLDQALTAYRASVPPTDLPQFDAYVQRVGRENILEQLRSGVVMRKIGEKLITINPADLGEVHAAHVLIRLQPGTDDAARKKNEADALKKAQMVLDEAKKPGADFGALAKKYSDDPGSAQNGGDLGFFGKGQMVPPFEAAAFNAQPGDIVGPVKSDFGYHIIKVIAHRTADQLSASDRDRRRNDLIQRLSAEPVREWMDLQRKNAKIVTYPLK